MKLEVPFELFVFQTVGVILESYVLMCNQGNDFCPITGRTQRANHSAVKYWVILSYPFWRYHINDACSRVDMVPLQMPRTNTFVNRLHAWKNTRLIISDALPRADPCMQRVSLNYINCWRLCQTATTQVIIHRHAHFCFLCDIPSPLQASKFVLCVKWWICLYCLHECIKA